MGLWGILGMIGLMYGQDSVVLQDLNHPTFLYVEGEEVFALDNHQVKVFKKDTGALIHSFGKLGQGPGELVPSDEIPLQMTVLRDEIVLNSQTKLIHYSRQGVLLKEKTLPFMCMQILPLGKQYLLTRVSLNEKQELYFKVLLFDGEFNTSRELYASEAVPILRTSEKISLPAPYLYMALSPLKQHIFLYSGRSSAFSIQVMDHTGKMLTPITMKTEPKTWSDDFKKSVFNWLFLEQKFRQDAALLKDRIGFCEHIPAIRNLMVGSDRIFVQTYLKKGDLSEFRQFSFGGQSLGNLYLPDDGQYPIKMNPDLTVCVDSRRYFYLVEDLDREVWMLRSCPIK